MRTLMPKDSQQTSATQPTMLSRSHVGQRRDATSMLHRPRAIGDPAGHLPLRAPQPGVRGDSNAAEIARWGHDFSRIHVHTGGATSGSEAAVNPLSHRVPRIPLAGRFQEDSVRQPLIAPGPLTPVPAIPHTEDCGSPRRMVAVKSGTFHGGLALSTYYPYLVGRGYWVNDSTAGPFNTGSRVGSSIQLYGLVPSPCEPSQYRFAQTYQDTRLIRNGVHDPQEGQVIDDIARSGQDQSRAPFRQLFLDTVGGEGLAISMGDPPSEAYGPSDNLEWDCSYVTSLVGPVGRLSVSWSTSVRVVNGAVTRNTLS